MSGSADHMVRGPCSAAIRTISPHTITRMFIQPTEARNFVGALPGYCLVVLRRNLSLCSASCRESRIEDTEECDLVVHALEILARH